MSRVNSFRVFYLDSAFRTYFTLFSLTYFISKSTYFIYIVRLLYHTVLALFLKGKKLEFYFAYPICIV